MIEDVILISALTSVIIILFLNRKNPKSNRILASTHFLSKSNIEPSIQSKYVLYNLKQRLSMLFPPPNGFRKKFTGILSMLNNKDIMSEIQLLEGPKSFTINKKNIYLCLKDKNSDEQYYDYNSLIFVTLHEIAHVLCDEIGHTNKFIQIFNALLNHATSLDLYDRTKPFVENYCSS